MLQVVPQHGWPELPHDPHEPDWQSVPDAHTAPHAPQLLLSALVFAQRPLQQLGLPPAQTFPHDPHDDGSLCKSTHVAPHDVRPPGHTHDPPEHERPPVHALPQEPQLPLSVCASTHEPPQSNPEHTHWPDPLQLRPPLQPPHDPPQPSPPHDRPAQFGEHAVSIPWWSLSTTSDASVVAPSITAASTRPASTGIVRTSRDTQRPSSPQVMSSSSHRAPTVHDASGVRVQSVDGVAHANARKIRTCVGVPGTNTSRATRRNVTAASPGLSGRICASIVSVTASSRGPSARGTMPKVPGRRIESDTGPRRHTWVSAMASAGAAVRATVATINIVRESGTSVSSATTISVGGPMHATIAIPASNATSGRTERG